MLGHHKTVFIWLGLLAKCRMGTTSGMQPSNAVRHRFQDCALFKYRTLSMKNRTTVPIFHRIRNVSAKLNTLYP